MILVHLLQLLLNDLRLRATCMLLCKQPLTLPEMCGEIHFVWVQHDWLSATPVLIAYRLTVATVLSPFNQMHKICPVRWRCNKRPFHLPTWTASEGKRLRTIAENSGTKEVISIPFCQRFCRYLICSSGSIYARSITFTWILSWPDETCLLMAYCSTQVASKVPIKFQVFSRFQQLCSL